MRKLEPRHPGRHILAKYDADEATGLRFLCPVAEIEALNSGG